MKLISLLLLALSSPALLAQPLQGMNSQSPATQLKITGGIIEGIQEKPGVTVFKGVPYAAPPVGKLRWREPQPVSPWKGVKKADKFGAAAMQEDQPKGGFYQHEFYQTGDPERSEDCLYLNVWTPAAGKPNQKLPVAMYIHGGGFAHGFGHEIEFDGKAWAKRGVILVTINYRLGPLGFFSHPLLSAESPNHTSGNQGILDQIAALKWIKSNIVQFGGNPDNVTVFGQSAGAVAVEDLCQSPLTKGMIAKAIIMSGGGVSETNLPASGKAELAQSEETSREMYDYFGLKTLNQMRAYGATDLFELPDKYTKAMLEKQGLKAETAGVGDVSNSKAMHTKGYQSYNELMGKMVRSTQRTAAETTPEASTSVPNPRQQIRTPRSGPLVDSYSVTETFSDAAKAGKLPDIPYMIGFVTNDIAPLAEGIDSFCLIREKQGRPAYGYEFARELPGDDARAFHSGELWYIFNTLGRSWRPVTDADLALSERMVNSWTNFAKYGNPNGKEKQVWKPFTKDNPHFYKFDIRK